MGTHSIHDVCPPRKVSHASKPPRLPGRSQTCPTLQGADVGATDAACAPKGERHLLANHHH